VAAAAVSTYVPSLVDRARHGSCRPQPYRGRQKTYACLASDDRPRDWGLRQLRDHHNAAGPAWDSTESGVGSIVGDHFDRETVAQDPSNSSPSNQPFLPGGAVNPCPETAPFCLIVENIRMDAGVGQRLSASLIATGLVGGQFIGGIPGAPGFGVVGVGRPVTVFAASRVGRRPRVTGLPVLRSRRAPVTRASSARRISAASACKGGVAARPCAGMGAPSGSSALAESQASGAATVRLAGSAS
jgi:hypothetical protein